MRDVSTFDLSVSEVINIHNSNMIKQVHELNINLLVFDGRPRFRF